MNYKSGIIALRDEGKSLEEIVNEIRGRTGMDLSKQEVATILREKVRKEYQP